MAKKGYRGQHPYNDMKVAPTQDKAANKSKLKAEYNRIGVKNKYDYIKSHDGFDFAVRGSAAVTGHASIGNDATIKIYSTDGTGITFSAVAGATNTTNKTFKSNGNATDAMEGLRDNINVNFAGRVTASAAKADGVTACASTDCVCTMTQIEPGPDGNTTITTAGTWTGATVASKFTGG